MLTDEEAIPESSRSLLEAWNAADFQERRKIVFRLVRNLLVEPAHGRRGIPTEERVKMRLFGAMQSNYLIDVNGNRVRLGSEKARFDALGASSPRV